MLDKKTKKLLVLGDNVSSVEIIQMAKNLGAVTVAADNLPNSNFKKYADISWNISTSDLDSLEKMAKQEGVTAVFAGASEFNIEQALLLSERLKTPFYATYKQWRLLSNKRSFKDLCKFYNIPVVDEYDFSKGVPNNKNSFKYPIIIKPVDGTAGLGISVCKNYDELLLGYKHALTYSKSKHVIVERYMTGDEVVIYYTLQDGYISLSAMCDRYTIKQPGVAPLPSAYVFPSKHLKEYQKYDDENVKKMFSDLKMKNGFLFVQSFIEDGRVRFYEMGYRIAGAQGQNIISAVNGVNALEMLVRFSLTGKMSGYDLKTQDTANFKKYACKLTPILKKGKISKIYGLDKIEAIDGVSKIVSVNNVGDVIDESAIGTLRQLLTRIYLVADTLDELKSKINKIQETLVVYDENGEDMILEKFDTNIL